MPGGVCGGEGGEDLLHEFQAGCWQSSLDKLRSVYLSLVVTFRQRTGESYPGLVDHPMFCRVSQWSSVRETTLVCSRDESASLAQVTSGTTSAANPQCSES